MENYLRSQSTKDYIDLLYGKDEESKSVKKRIMDFDEEKPKVA
jgi:hypothetical protein